METQAYLYGGIILLSVAVIASVCGISCLGLKYVNSLARQPEMSSMLQSRFLILLASFELIPLVTMVMGVMLLMRA